MTSNLRKLLGFVPRNHAPRSIATEADKIESREESRDTEVYIGSSAEPDPLVDSDLPTEPDPPAALYSPLDATKNQIRVLSLKGVQPVPLEDAHPNALHVSDHAITCDFEVTSLTELRQGQERPYTALSYVWGSMPNGRRVIVNGVIRKVTLNLYNALWHIVSDTRTTLPYRLWVDALCINQDDMAEKTQQVQFMGEIYRSARDVVVWLGTGAGQDGLGFDEFWESFKAKDEDTDLSAADLQTGATFLERSDWFRRSWTFQEIVLAPKDHVVIRCGYHVVPWSDFARRAGTMITDIRKVIRDIESARKLMDRSDDAATNNFGATNDQQKHVKLANLMALTAGREASDNRDKIFSLFGMYPHAASLEVGYDRDIGYIYCRVAFRIMEEMENLSVFWLVDFRSWSSRFRGIVNRDYLYAGLHYGLTVASGSIFDSQTTRHKSWAPLLDSIQPDYLFQILENDAARSDFDMRRLHPAFTMNVRLDEESLVAEGAILGHYIACAPKPDGAPRDVKGVCDHTVRPFPACLMNNQTAFVTKPRKKPGHGLLTKAYKPRWIDAKTVYKELRRHQEMLCDCQTTKQDQSQPKTPTSGTKTGQSTQATSEGRGKSYRRIFWSCVVFGFPEPLVVEPSFDAEHDSLTFSLIALYDADDLLYKAIDALSVGETQIAGEDMDFVEESNMNLQSEPPSPEPVASGRTGWKSPEEIFSHMGVKVNWMPTTFKLRNRPKSLDELLDD